MGKSVSDAKRSSDVKRCRFAVPEADEATLLWMDAQLNLSTSLRALIRKDVQENGYTDVTCRTIEQGAKRGRPSNAELERRAMQNGESTGDVLAVTNKRPVAPKAAQKRPIQAEQTIDPPPVERASEPAVEPKAPASTKVNRPITTESEHNDAAQDVLARLDPKSASKSAQQKTPDALSMALDSITA